MGDSLVAMARDFASRLYTVQKDSYEESAADTKFPLSVRWRKAEVPMILLNQHDVQGLGGDGDISIFARALRSMRHQTAQNWWHIASEGRYELINFEQDESRRRRQIEQSGVVEDSEEAKRKKLDMLL